MATRGPDTRRRDLIDAIGARRREAWRRHVEESPAAPYAYAAMEELPEAAWQRLKQNILGQIDRRHPPRGWPQVLDLLHEARAFGYLNRLGCAEISFSAPTMNARSPDLSARLGQRRVLCEVKTIRLPAMDTLPASFARKLRTRLSDAAEQLAADDDEAALRLIYLIVDGGEGLVGEELAAEVTQYARKALPDGHNLVIDLGASITAIG